jgi:hypothetical protein
VDAELSIHSIKGEVVVEENRKGGKPDQETQEDYLDVLAKTAGISRNALATMVKNNSPDASSLREEVVELTSTYSALRNDFGNLRSEIERASQDQFKRSARIAEEIATLDKKLDSALSVYSKKMDSIREAAEREFQQTISGLAAAFTEQQAIREPVKLWETKLAEHAQAKRLNLNLFIAGLVAAATFVCALMYVLAFEAAFVEILLAPIGCDPAVGGSACAGFSLKGTLLTAGVLTLFTLLLWFVRLQMKLFLAERHLALDARERQAFAQSYLGLVREGDVSEEAKEQRALVYAALFRPSSDGTVRDEGGVDPSVAAAISKILMR